MKKLKLTAGYETTLTTEYDVDGWIAAGGRSVWTKGRRQYTGCHKESNLHPVTRSIWTIVLLAGLTGKIIACSEIASFAQTSAGVEGDIGSAGDDAADSVLPGYWEYIAGYEPTVPSCEIQVGAKDCAGYEENGILTEAVFYTDYEELPGLSLYTGEGALAEFAVHVEEEGFYDISLMYYPMDGSESGLLRSILVDGEIPCREMAEVEFDRVWRVREDTLAEAPEWTTSYIYDRKGSIASPLSIYLKKGEHRISLRSVKGAMLIHEMTLEHVKPSQEYKQVKAFWDAVGIRETQGQLIRIGTAAVTGVSSRRLWPMEEQKAPAGFRVNAKASENPIAGGEAWDQAGQWIEWEFDVAESGYYRISLYDRQSYVKESPAYRKIMIDGDVPFAEMEQYGFTYGLNWREDVLSDEAGTPYAFYLKRGRHTICMEAVLSSQPLAIDHIDFVSADMDAAYASTSVFRRIGYGCERMLCALVRKL